MVRGGGGRLQDSTARLVGTIFSHNFGGAAGGFSCARSTIYAQRRGNIERSTTLLRARRMSAASLRRALREHPRAQPLRLAQLGDRRRRRRVSLPRQRVRAGRLPLPVQHSAGRRRLTRGRTRSETVVRSRPRRRVVVVVIVVVVVVERSRGARWVLRGRSARETMTWRGRGHLPARRTDQTDPFWGLVFLRREQTQNKRRGLSRPP